ILMHGQVRGLAPVAVAADFGKPSDQKIQEVALDGAARDSCQRGNLLVGNAVVLQPQHMHLALHERVRMIKAFVLDRSEVALRKGHVTHEQPPLDAYPPSAACFMRRTQLDKCAILTRNEYSAPLDERARDSQSKRQGGPVVTRL